MKHGEILFLEFPRLFLEIINGGENYKSVRIFVE